jgi:cullin-associated NEDD8-dissociated protein 1
MIANSCRHSDFKITPQEFMQQFTAKTDDVPLAAAVALGLAGAGNVKVYLPVIMERLEKGGDSYLLVHSLKEIIQHSGDEPAASEIKPHINKIWTTLINAATQNEDAKAVGAECIGRLTILDPYSFLPELQKQLKSPKAAVRGMVISALRYTFTDTDASYDELLRPIVVDFLESMLKDPELENRRLALTALNSAASNKFHLLAGPGLTCLLPLVYGESYVRPELVREIQMGPFRHRVDDGLEVRKSAYETLYALLETSFENLDIQAYYDRVIAGLEDEHDIRSLSNLMLVKLSTLAREETLIRLDKVSECFRTTLTSKPKDNAVKQEIERHKEGARAALKVSLTLQNMFGPSVPPKWKAYWDWALQNHNKEITEIMGSEDTAAGL